MMENGADSRGVRVSVFGWLSWARFALSLRHVVSFLPLSLTREQESYHGGANSHRPPPSGPRGHLKMRGASAAPPPALPRNSASTTSDGLTHRAFGNRRGGLMAARLTWSGRSRS